MCSPLLWRLLHNDVGPFLQISDKVIRHERRPQIIPIAYLRRPVVEATRHSAADVPRSARVREAIDQMVLETFDQTFLRAVEKPLG